MADSDIPRPAASRMPPRPLDKDTSPDIATGRYVKSKVNPLVKQIRALGVVSGVIVTSVAGFFVFMDNRVEAQTKKANEVQSEKHDALKARVETLEKRFDRFEERTDKQMNAALDALRVPDTKRPPPLDKDAGP